MTHTGPTLAEIKAAAQARIFDVLAALGIHDKPRGGYIHICNPIEKDRRPSFTIWTTRSVGAWKDHRGIAQGDVIDLVAYLKGWSDGPKKGRREALRFLADLLGLARMTSEQRAADNARSKARRLVEDKRALEELADKQRRAFELWCRALPIGAAGTGAERGRAYLKGRGIDLEALPKGPRGGDRTPSVLRVLPLHKHVWIEPKSPRHGSESFPPALIAACWDPATARILAVHRTWLKADGSGKADVEPNRKCWPDFRGLVIPLWRGDSGLSIAEAIACGLRETLVLAEGIETALSAAIAAPQFRTWAFISLGNLGNIALPECIDAVLLHRENEWTNRTAIASFDRGKRALEAQGRPVAEISAFGGKDLNDTLRGAA